MSDDLRSALADAGNASAALALLIRYVKAQNPKMTLGFLAKRAGIPSTGYLSDVMSGRRQLLLKYREPLLDAVGADGTVRSLLAVLLSIDDLPQEEVPADLVKERDGIRKLLKQESRRFPERLAGMFFAFEVFAAFGLSGQKATREKLRDFFGVSRGVEIEQALALLLQSGLIERQGDVFAVVSDQFYFIGKDGLSHIDYLTLALRDAEKKVNSWYEKPDQSFFTSSVVSVKDRAYRAALPTIKSAIQRMESDLESGEADRLVRVNVQIYPLEQ